MSELSTVMEQGQEVQSSPEISVDYASQPENKGLNQQIGQEQKTLLTDGGGQSVQNPESYVFEFSDNTLIDQDLMQDFKNFAAQNNMNVESAKQMAKFYESYVQKQQANQGQKLNAAQTTMEQQCINDAEFGGAKLHDNLRYARAALTKFDNGQLVKILNSSGFGSHPEVIRFMYRVGKALAEKDMVSGLKAQREPSAAELFYPSMKKS